jgi:hypothetical protein
LLLGPKKVDFVFTRHCMKVQISESRSMDRLDRKGGKELSLTFFFSHPSTSAQCSAQSPVIMQHTYLAL